MMDEEEKISKKRAELRNMKKLLNKKTKKGNRRRNKKDIVLEYLSLKLGIRKTLCLITVLIIILLVIKTVFAMIMMKSLEIIQNLLEAYLLGIATWNSVFPLHTYFMEATLWNNTVPTWDGKSTLDTYNYYRNFVEKKIIANYTNLLDVDLGNYSDGFKFALSKGNSCKLIFSYGNDITRMCYLYNNGLFTGNLINAFKGMLTNLDWLIEDWQAKRHDWAQVKGMFKTQKYAFIISTFQQSIFNFFYWSAIDTLKYFNEYTERHKRLYQITDIIFYLCCGVTAVVVIYFSVQKIQRSMVVVYSMLFIMPMSLIQKNKVLSVRLMKLAKGEIEDIC